MADNIRGPSHGYNLYNDLVRAFEKRTISSNLRWPVLNEYGWECHGRYLYQLRADKIKRNRFKDFSLAATLLRDEPLKQLWPPKPVEMPERVSNLTAIQKNKDRQRKLNYNIPNIIKKKVWQTSKPVEMRAERLRSECTDDLHSHSVYRCCSVCFLGLTNSNTHAYSNYIVSYNWPISGIYDCILK